MTAKDVAARAAKLSTRNPAQRPAAAVDASSTDEAPQPIRSVARSAPRAKPVRVSTDLAPQSYRALLAFCAELAESTGRARVPHVEVIRSLIVELESNPELRTTIRTSVIQQMSK